MARVRFQNIVVSFIYGETGVLGENHWPAASHCRTNFIT